MARENDNKSSFAFVSNTILEDDAAANEEIMELLMNNESDNEAELVVAAMQSNMFGSNDRVPGVRMKGYVENTVWRYT